MKENFIRQLQEDAAALARVVATVRDHKQVYLDRGYSPGGSDPITDDDVLAATENDTLTANDFAPTGNGVAALMVQLLNLVDGDVVISANYGEALNKVRNDV